MITPGIAFDIAHGVQVVGGSILSASRVPLEISFPAGPDKLNGLYDFVRTIHTLLELYRVRVSDTSIRMESKLSSIVQGHFGNVYDYANEIVKQSSLMDSQ